MSGYTAENIQILTADEAAERFGWAKVAEWAEQYHRPAEWIARGLEACRRAGVPPDYFERRYLRREPLPRHAGVDEAMRAMVRDREGGQ
jgi:hypothetical protein